ncbi:hypothetical protein J6590_080258 [Homalodisca vitripennis]|nr:hypothetical protein J6590_080258 [Homalodisca vitripennis]
MEITNYISIHTISEILGEICSQTRDSFVGSQNVPDSWGPEQCDLAFRPVSLRDKDFLLIGQDRKHPRSRGEVSTLPGIISWTARLS